MIETATEPKTGLDAFDELAKLAKEQPEQLPDATLDGVIDEAFEYEPLPVNLPSDWKFADWKQRHIMGLVESGCFDSDYPNKWRRNYEVVKVAIEQDCFERPMNVTADDLLDVDTMEVEQIWTAVNAEFINRVNVPKK